MNAESSTPTAEERIAARRKQRLLREFSHKRALYTLLSAVTLIASVLVSVYASANLGFLLGLLGLIWLTISFDLNGMVHEVRNRPMRYLTLDLSVVDGGVGRGEATSPRSTESGSAN